MPRVLSKLQVYHSRQFTCSKLDLCNRSFKVNLRQHKFCWRSRLKSKQTLFQAIFVKRSCLQWPQWKSKGSHLILPYGTMYLLCSFLHSDMDTWWTGLWKNVLHKTGSWCKKGCRPLVYEELVVLCSGAHL